MFSLKIHNLTFAGPLLLAICSVASFGSGGLSCARAQPSPQTNAASDNAALRLELKVLGRKYCEGDAEGGILQLRILLEYQNAGTEPLILYKGSNAIQELTVSHNTEDLAFKQFETRMLLTPVIAQSQAIRPGPRPGSAFVVLQGTHYFRTEAVVPVPFTPAKQSGVRVGPGSHVLQVEVATWPESRELAIDLRRLWQKSGHLWFEPAKSLPVLFEIDRSPKIETCE